MRGPMTGPRTRRTSGAMTGRTPRHSAWLVGLVVASLGASCGEPTISDAEHGAAPRSSGGDQGAPGTSGKPGDFNFGPPGAPPAGAGTPNSSNPAANEPGGADAVKACAETKAETARLPVDLYIVQDRSGSMGMGGKWEAVKNALIAFVQSPAAAGMQVGLGFFPREGTGAACMGCNDARCLQMCGCSSVQCTNGACRCNAYGPTCAVPDYTPAAVGIEPLPGVAPKIVAALNATMPTGGTPTRPALEGGVAHARTWLTSKNRRVAIALATDGEPTGCMDNTVATVADVAKKAYADGIYTFVIGVGPNLANLNAMAMAGGTGKAFLIEGGNVQQQFFDTLKSIQGQAARLSCSYAVPPAPTGQTLDPKKVNVRFTGGEPAKSVYIPHVEDRAKCGPQGGWYYDDPTTPKAITLCEASCQSVNQGGEKAEVAVLFGCATRIIP